MNNTVMIVFHLWRIGEQVLYIQDTGNLVETTHEQACTKPSLSSKEKCKELTHIFDSQTKQTFELGFTRFLTQWIYDHNLYIIE